MPTKLETPTHRIAVDFTTRQTYMLHNRGRSCKAKCGSCGQKWPDIDSVNVHYVVEKATGNQTYWCDSCLKIQTEINANQKSVGQI